MASMKAWNVPMGTCYTMSQTTRSSFSYSGEKRRGLMIAIGQLSCDTIFRKMKGQGRIYKFGAPRPTDQRAPPPSPEDSDYTDVEIQ
ncbi:hypothetical protein J6590_066653 [Homalodisca vitripennis]|nr:hypothetical protein J6590_066653 [Homalodisca vitripennis]